MLMSMTLMDAQKYDAARDRRRRKRIVIGDYRRSASRLGRLPLSRLPRAPCSEQFFAALQKQNYEAAYGIWFSDPDWKQHPSKYSNYPFNEFNQDWGPGGEWGTGEDLTRSIVR